MFKVSAKKEAEMLVWEWFCLRGENFRERTEEDVKVFFEWSEKGKHKDRLDLTKATMKNPEDYHSYANKLYIGKVWAGRTVHELWEPSFYSDTWDGWRNILKDMPVEVMEWVRKEIFRGVDAELIKQLWNEENSS